MITVSISKLLGAIEEAEAFKLPRMSAGAEYLYNNLYKRLTNGEELRLSQINWGGFELDDVDTVRELYSDTLENNERKADSIVSTLRGLSPTVTAAAFV